jgi:CO/xanthine dehydrogenase Mo-binding subunit
MASVVGRAVPRKEGRSKVTGQARYVDDLTMPGLLHGVTVRSPVPRGRIRAIRFEGGLPWDEFTIVTARDVPAPNRIALIMNDQPCLADDVINHTEEPVVLLAHADKGLVERARQCVVIDVDPLPAVLSLDESLSGREVIWGADNVFKTYTVNSGDVDNALAAATTFALRWAAWRRRWFARAPRRPRCADTR